MDLLSNVCMYMCLYIYIYVCIYIYIGFPGGSDGKESTCNAGDPGSTPGLGRYIGEANSYPLQYSCLENSMVGGNTHTHTHTHTIIKGRR